MPKLRKEDAYTRTYSGSLAQFNLLQENQWALAQPENRQEKIKKLYLPSGKWYDVYGDSVMHGHLETSKEVPIFQLPIYIKESAIIPMQSVVQSTKEKPGDTLYLHIYNGAIKNVFTYYEDDGNTFSYASGNYCKRNIAFDPSKEQILLDQAKFTLNCLQGEGYLRIEKTNLSGTWMGATFENLRFVFDESWRQLENGLSQR